ncbi:MAG: hypothetical protein QXH27_03540 [Candidatus Micrarchaeia archaeon]
MSEIITGALWLSAVLWMVITLLLLRAYIDALSRKREARSLAALILVCFALAFENFVEGVLVANRQAGLPLAWVVPKAVLIIAAIEMFLVLRGELVE